MEEKTRTVENDLKVTPGTIARTIILVIAIINQILEMNGKSIIPIQDEQIQEVVSLIFDIVAFVWVFWKNNSFTKNALIADKVLSDLREVDENGK